MSYHLLYCLLYDEYVSLCKNIKICLDNGTEAKHIILIYLHLILWSFQWYNLRSPREFPYTGLANKKITMEILSQRTKHSQAGDTLPAILWSI